MKRKKALLALPHNELEGIYHLTESHTPGLRFTACVQYEKALNNNSIPKTLNKERINFRCSDTNLSDRINTMLKNVEEMPKEWTIVQLTPHFNPETSSSESTHTTPIHISIFNCGKGNTLPFWVTVNAPFDKIANHTIDICKEMMDIIQDNKLLIGNVQVTREGFFRHYKDKKTYQDARDTINCRLKVYSDFSFGT